MNPVIMPCRLGRQMTERAVHSIAAQDTPDVTLLAVDNGTSDGTGDYLRSLDHSIVMSFRPARGLSYVWNQALGFVFNQLRCDHALVVNNDAALRPDAYRLLLDDGGGFVTGVGVIPYDFPLTECHPEMRSPHPDFSCFLIRRSVWETVGPFDTAMVTWASDGDYHLRMERAGIYAYSIAVPYLHQVSGTLKHALPELRDEICKQADADRAVFKEKWGCEIGSAAYYSLFRSGDGKQPYQEHGRLA